LKVALIVEYDGSRYHGFEWQKGVPTIQGILEKAIRSVTTEERRVIAASRTDAGVHAEGQVVSFRTESKLPPDTILRAMNAYLPRDTAVRAAFHIREDFSVRGDATSREYTYTILNRPTRSPLLEGFSCLVPGQLDLAKMEEACHLLEGQHNFLSFVTSWENDRSPIRTIKQAGLERKGDLVFFRIKADSFLPHQVRNIIGMLTKLGLGKADMDEFRRIMEATRPGAAGPTAPARGLCLTRVNYAKPLGE
jgi:tRNA pseudouridine38-40 synthase